MPRQNCLDAGSLAAIPKYLDAIFSLAQLNFSEAETRLHPGEDAGC
jgi:hypothetical protein